MAQHWAESSSLLANVAECCSIDANWLIEESLPKRITSSVGATNFNILRLINLDYDLDRARAQIARTD